MTRLMPCHRNRHLMLPHQMQIALRFAPVVAEQAPPGPGNGETAFADFTSRMQPLRTRLHLRKIKMTGLMAHHHQRIAASEAIR